MKISGTFTIDGERLTMSFPGDLSIVHDASGDYLILDHKTGTSYVVLGSDPIWDAVQAIVGLLQLRNTTS